MVTFALTLSDLIEKGGSYAGLVAFFGIAVLAILFFSQARELKRLREWAGRAPERAQELEQRVVEQAEQARRVRAEPQTQAARGPATVAGQQTTATGQQATVAAAAVPVAEGPMSEEQAAQAAEQEAAPAEQPAVAATTAPGQPAAAPEETPEPDGREVAGAGAAVASAAAPAQAATPAAPATPGVGGNGVPPAGEIPALPPRATQGPPAIRRPAPAPLRATTGSTSAVTRRPPPRRPGQPAPLASGGRPPESPARRRRAILALGGFAGIGLVALGLIALLGGGGGNDKPASPGTGAQVQPRTPSSTGSGNSGAPSRSDTSIAVLNGTTIPGLASTVGTTLAQAGYSASQPPADYTDQARSASVVFYATSQYRSQAFEVAKLLNVSDRQPIVESASGLAPGADVVVVVGADQTP